jgi:hypothetical protein
MVITLNEIICPICNKEQKQKPKKTWAYGKMIEARTIDGTKWGASVRCSNYECKCGKSFRYYLTSKGKSWTIPKKKLSTK